MQKSAAWEFHGVPLGDTKTILISKPLIEAVMTGLRLEADIRTLANRLRERREAFSPRILVAD
jgi:hypothetical protein